MAMENSPTSSASNTEHISLSSSMKLDSLSDVRQGVENLKVSAPEQSNPQSQYIARVFDLSFRQSSFTAMDQDEPKRKVSSNLVKLGYYLLREDSQILGEYASVRVEQDDTLSDVIIEIKKEQPFQKVSFQIYALSKVLTMEEKQLFIGNLSGKLEFLKNRALQSSPLSHRLDIQELKSFVGTLHYPLFIKVIQHNAASDLSRNNSDLSTSEKRNLSAEILLNEWTNRLVSFVDASFEDGILSCKEFLPYTQQKMNKLFVRKCYEEVFELFLAKIKSGKEKFGISGTPGVGKSLFFLYILFRVLKGDSSLQPKRIVYQSGSRFWLFDLEVRCVNVIDELRATSFVQQTDTLYIIDGSSSEPTLSFCITLFICSPRSEYYKGYVKQVTPAEWFFPVWTLEELTACRERCYPGLSEEFLLERFRIYGGVARFIFHDDFDVQVPDKMEKALEDVNAAEGVRYHGEVSDIYPVSHTLLHMLVGVKNNRSYQFIGFNIASKYVGDQLFQRHYSQMLTNLQNMLGGSPSVLSRNLFELYGNCVFSKGGKKLECRNLETGLAEDFTLQAFDADTTCFGRNTIPTTLPTSYYETSDDETFPAIDSLSPQGMFQFTVGSEHSIRGVQILNKICKLFEVQGKPLKLHFVVPPKRFDSFKKQEFKSKIGNDSVDEIKGLTQYVVKLPVGIEHNPLNN